MTERRISMRGDIMAGSVTTKVLYQNCDTFLQAGLKKKDKIDEDQLQLINSRKDMGFLGIRWEKTAARNVLKYNVSNMTALSEYIKQTMTQEKYFRIISQFQKIYEFCATTDGLSADNLLLGDMKNVYYDTEKQRIFVAYLPLSENIYKCANVVKFLSKVNKSASITISNGTVMQKYGFCLEDLMGKQNSKTPRNGGLSYAQLHTLLHDVLSIPEEDPAAAIVNNADMQAPAAGAAESAADDDGDHTILVSRRSSDCLAFLKDENNREFPIDHVPFTIGRRPDNDIALTDKGTVSKVHAAISVEDGGWFVEDRGSANGTFLNDFAENARRITREPITSGDVIYIYDVPFVFTENAADSATIIVGENGGRKNEAPKNKVKKIAYFINGSSNERIPVFVYPFTCAELSGIIIDRESNGSRHNICIENISCNSLNVEGSDIPAGEKTVIFSGCNFLYHGISYTFYEEN